MNSDFVFIMIMRNYLFGQTRLAVCLLVFVPVLAWSGEFVWFDGNSPVSYSLPRGGEPVVATAALMFEEDMEAVTGLRAQQVNEKRAAIRVMIKADDGNDGFEISVKDQHLLIVGNSGRGAAYGLLELSRMAGVSPWIWWGDVIPERKERLSVDDDFYMSHRASVAYRGIFINDEDWSIRPWACQTFDKGAGKGTISAQAYKKVFQLLLRLRGNTIWPAMHGGTTAFFKTPGAKMMADSCGIVIGSSHCEPLLRNNVEEWDDNTRGEYNYITNRQNVLDYWTERLKEVGKGSEDLFTIGMRGIHDGSMLGVKTLQEKTDALQRVINDQRLLLGKYVNKNLGKVNQVFIPYKEVLDIYENGLQVPDDVTLMWCDDNYGYLTRLSDEKQQQRSGGSGIYYHISYWGRPHDYLWLCTTQPGLLYNEMLQAWNHNARKLWIVNVHDPKVAGYDLELFLDLAWDMECVKNGAVSSHYREWLTRQFGEEAADVLFPAMVDFYRQCSIRKPEFMGWTQVELDKKKYPRGLSTVGRVELTPREAGKRMGAMNRIKAAVVEARPLVRPELNDAYFAAILYPVFATAAMNAKILSDSIESHRAYLEIKGLTEQYNRLAGGRWQGLLNDNPRNLPVFDDVHATLAVEREKRNENAIVDIARNACDYDDASKGAMRVEMLGRSNGAMALPKGGTLTYEVEMPEDVEANLHVAVIPTQANDKGDVRFSVACNEDEPTVFSIKEPFRSEQWKLNVLRGQALCTLKVHLNKGSNRIQIKAIDDHIVADQWMLDFQMGTPPYLFPVDD